MTADDGENGAYFGRSVSISGDFIIVGADGDDDNGSYSGSAYIFHRDGTDWEQEYKLTPLDAYTMDAFGKSVSISGDYAIIGSDGSNGNATNCGAAYVYYFDGTDWSFQAKLIADDGEFNDHFGSSVSIDGDYAVVGADYDKLDGSPNGSVYVFCRSGTTWTQQATLFASDGAGSDYFGESVSIDGHYAVIGAEGDDDNGGWSGSAYVFYRSGTEWTEQAKLTASDGAGGDYFGESVSVDGDYVVVGAYGDDDGGSDSGSAYIFYRSGTTWTQQAKLTASDGEASDHLGLSVSLSGHKALVGVPYDDGDQRIFQGLHGCSNGAAPNGRSKKDSKPPPSTPRMMNLGRPSPYRMDQGALPL